MNVVGNAKSHSRLCSARTIPRLQCVLSSEIGELRFNLLPSLSMLILINRAGGATGNSEGTIEWAGGEVDFSKAPFSMIVKSVSITNANPACEYKYKDMTGSFSSIDVVVTSGK